MFYILIEIYLMIGMAELLLDVELNEEQREYAENIFRSGNALLTVINDILDFSKVESGRLDIEVCSFLIPSLCRPGIDHVAHDRRSNSACLSLCETWRKC